MRIAPIVLTTALFGLAFASWLFLGPSNVRGPVAYLVTSGSSMEPYMHRGDLAVVRVGRNGSVGDILAYRNSATGQRVLHRVIAKDQDRFILQGDNNSWVDTFQPTSDDLVGRLWFRIPKVGRAVEWMRAPVHAGLLMGGGTAVGLFMGMSPVRRKWRRLGLRDRFRGQRGLLLAASSTGGQTALGIGLGVALLSIAASGVLWALPTQHVSTAHLEYQHRGVFSYHAETVLPVAAAGPLPGRTAPIEPSGDVQVPDLVMLAADPVVAALLDVPVKTGEPILVNVNPKVNFAFDYYLGALGASGQGEVSGVVRLDAVVSDITGWNRVFPFAPEQSFTGDHVRVSVKDADLTPLMAAFPIYQAITGHAPRYYTASIVAVVTVSGTLQGQPLQETFRPGVTFRIAPPNEIYVETEQTRDFEVHGTTPADRSDAEQPDPFETVRTNSVPYEVNSPNTIPIFGFDIRVTSLRMLLSAIALSAIGVAGGLFMLQRLGEAQGESFLIEAWHGRRIVTLDEGSAAGHHPTTFVAGVRDLMRIADHSGAPIMRSEDERGLTYSVRDGDQVYGYVVAAEG